MAISVAERQYLLAELERLAQADLDNLWLIAEGLPTGEFFTYMRDALPEVADTYHQMAGQLAATWFEESDPESDYVARVAEPIVRDRLLKSAEWALGADGDAAKDRMAGTLQRAVYEGSRETVVVNVEQTDSRWLRVARADACPFCRMLATRTGDYAYTSKKSALVRKSGRSYHDLCHCQAVEIRSNQSVDDVLTDEQRKLLQQWDDEYQKSVANAGSTNTKAVMSAWREQLPATTPAATAVAKLDRAVLDNASTVDDVARFLRTNHGLNVDGLINSPLSRETTVEVPQMLGGPPQKVTLEPRFVEAKVAREYAQGVDDMLVKYPFLKLDAVDADWNTVGDLGCPAFAEMKMDGNKVVGAKRVSISAGFTDTKGNAGQAWQRRENWMNSDTYDAGYKKAAVGRPIYKTAVHEMGHDMDYTGGLKARQTAGIALREHIMQTPGAIKIRDKILAGESKTGLGAFERLYGGRFDITPEYQAYERRWLRKNIVSAYSFRDSDRKKAVINMPEALAEAFTDVELRGEKASEASKVMYAELIKAAKEATGA